MGYKRSRKNGVKATPSIKQKMRKTTNVSEKFISDDTFFENRKRYFGTFTLENIEALSISDAIPEPVASLKNEKTMLPQKR